MSDFDLKGASITQSVLGDNATGNFANRTSSVFPDKSEIIELKNVQHELKKIKESLCRDLERIEKLEACAQNGSMKKLKETAKELSKGIAAGTVGNMLAAFLQKLLGL